MALVLADSGAVDILTKYFNTTGNNLTVKLYVTPHTPTDTDTYLSYVEAAGGGYTAGTMTAGSHVVSIKNNIAQAQYPVLSFVFTGPLTTNSTIYGYYVVNGSGTLIYAESLVQSFTPLNNNDTLQLTLKFQMSKGTPT
jgi:hypothetical protein